MKLIAAANTIENPGLDEFLRDAATIHPTAQFALCGDLVNIFPEPGEDLRASIFHTLYGDFMIDEMARLHAAHFVDVTHSRFVKPLQELFDEGGCMAAKCRALAARRYARVFGGMRNALQKRALYFIPGNMDYPELTELFAAACPQIHCLDGAVSEVDGVMLAGVGGIPSSAQPFYGVAKISPYEMSDAAYAAQLDRVRGCDVLLTHLAPEECTALRDFMRDSSVRAVVCRAPFNLARSVDCRGVSELTRQNDKLVMKVRPFEYPENATFVLNVAPDPKSDPTVDIFTWKAPLPAATEAGRAPELRDTP